MKFAPLLVSVFLISACAPVPVPVDYSPGSAVGVKGKVEIGAFRYLPFDEGHLKIGQMANTAVMYHADINPDVPTFVHDAIVKELRFAGIDLSENDLALTGQIKELSCDDGLGGMGVGAGDAHWRVLIQYVVASKRSGKPVYQSDKLFLADGLPFGADPPTLNRMIRGNIELLLQDGDFVEAINK